MINVSMLLRFSKILSAKNGSRFRRNFVHAARGNLIGQGIPLLAAPVLTRLYGPNDFAALSMFAAALGFLTAVGCWRVDWMVPNAASREEALSLMLLGTGVLIVISLIATVLAWFEPPLLTQWKGMSVLGNLMLLLPVALVGTVIQQLLQSWFVREADLAPTSQARISQSMVNAGFSLTGGWLGLRNTGLIISSVLSAWAGVGTLLRHSFQDFRVTMRLTKFHIAQSAKKFAGEATWSTGIAVANVAGINVMFLLLMQYYPVREVGWVSLMNRMAMAPIAVITQGVAQSFWAEAAQLSTTDRANLKELYFRTTKRLLFLSLPVSAICLLGPIYVGPIFGKTEWTGSGLVLAALTPMIVGWITFAPTNHLVVFHKQKYQMFADLMRLILISLCIYFSANIGLSIYSAVVLSSLASLFSHVILFIVHLRVCYGSD